MKPLATILLVCGLSWVAQAQTAFDALRFSTFNPGGTARTMGVGGAIGALGADFTVFSTNPAGVAAYRKSEFVFSPEWFSNRTLSTLNGDIPNETIRESRVNININNVGLVFSIRPTASDWKTVNFGFGMNRTANFHQEIRFEGVSQGSITNRFIELADGFLSGQLDDFEAGLAYETGAIYNPDPLDGTIYRSDFTPAENVLKEQVVRAEGSINELVFSLAGNYGEKLYLGATIGVPILNYEEEKLYSEEDPTDENPLFEYLEYNEFLQTDATGINLKLGAIYKPIQAFRIGAAIHTPTSFGMEDTYSTQMAYAYQFNGLQELYAESPNGFYEYRLRTPWRAIGSAAVVVKKYGFLTGEVEWADYSTAAFNFNRSFNQEDLDYEQELNQQIAETFQSAITLRLGAELVFDIFRIRGGYNIIQSPYAGSDFTNVAYSGGFGIREKNFYLDLAYRRAEAAEVYFPYITAELPQAEVEQEVLTQHFLVTVGFKL